MLIKLPDVYRRQEVHESGYALRVLFKHGGVFKNFRPHVVYVRNDFFVRAFGGFKGSEFILKLFNHKPVDVKRMSFVGANIGVAILFLPRQE